MSPEEDADFSPASIIVNLPKRNKTFETLSMEEFEAEIEKLQREVEVSPADSLPELTSPFGDASSASESPDSPYASLDIYGCRWRDCNTVFSTLDALVDHISNDHLGKGKSTYVCYWEGCERNCRPFVKRHKISNHLRKHTGERPYPCTVADCGKRFTRRDSLAAHMKTHGNTPKFRCSIEGCGKSFHQLKALHKHNSSHKDPQTMQDFRRYHPYSAMGYSPPALKSKC